MSVNVKCGKCNGKVFVDTTFDTKELFCIICGKRWHQIPWDIYYLLRD